MNVEVRSTGQPVAHQVRTLRAVLIPRLNPNRILLPLMMVSGLVVMAILVASSTTNGEEPEWADDLDVMELRWEETGLNVSLDGPGIWDMELSPDYKYLAASTIEYCYIIDIENQTIFRKISFPNSSLVDATWSPDGRYLAVSNRDWISVVILNAETWEINQILEWHDARPFDSGICLDWNPNGSFLATSFQGALIFWNTTTWEVYYYCYVPGKVWSIEWSPDGKLIAAPNSYGLAVVSFEERKVIFTVGHSYRTQRNFIRASWNPDGSRMVLPSFEIYNYVAYIYDTDNFSLIKTIEGHTYPLADARWSSDGKVLVTTSLDHTIVFWNPSNWSIIQRCTLDEYAGDIRWKSDLTSFFVQIGAGFGNTTVREFQIPESRLISLEYTESATTGDPFRVEVNVSSILPLRSVSLVHRCPGDVWVTANMTYVNNDTFRAMVMIPDRLGDLEFRVEVTDTYGRTTTSDIWTLPVHDNDPPVIGDDTSDAIGWSGHPFRFEVTASDNIQVSTVEVTYWIGGDRASIPMGTVEGSYSATIVLPQVLESLKYAFTVTDSSGSIAESLLVSMDIIDIDIPVISIEPPGTATTGDPYVVTCHLEDNIALSEAWMEWGIDGLTDRQTIPLVEDNPLLVTVTVPHSMGTLHFVVRARDTSGNENSSAEMEVEVVDNDEPYLLEDLTEPTAYTGRDHTITVRVDDNIAVRKVVATYSFDGGDTLEGILEPTTSLHSLSIHMPEDARVLEYRITVVDTSGNTNGTEVRKVAVLDVIAPTISGSGDFSIHTGDSFILTANGGDNRDWVDVTTYLRYPGGDWTDRTIRAGMAFNLSITSEELNASTSGFCDVIQFWIEAVDASGNAVSLGSEDEPHLVTVIDDEPPSIKLHGPTRCVTGEFVVFDADDSVDNVGIEGYAWTVDGPEEISWSGSTVETSFTRSGDYTIHLVVTDGSGNQATRDYYVRVDEAPDMDPGQDQLLFLVVILGVFLSTLALLVTVRR